MPCNHINLPGGGSAIICSRSSQKRCAGGRPATKLCDFPLAGTKAGKTCDKPLCVVCAVHREPDIDYCRPHAELLDRKTEAARP